MNFIVILAVLCMASAAFAAAAPDWAKADLKIGIIGTDTSHVPSFTDVLHAHPEWRLKVTAAYKGGSPEMALSRDRVEKFAADLHDRHQVEIVPDIPALLAKVDAVMIESVDGRQHLDQARPVLAAGKRLFIDKPFTTTLADAREIIRLAKEAKTPFFSCSCTRFQTEISRFRTDAGVGKVAKVQASGPLHIIPETPDLFWYGIHGIEALYTVMGPGCVSLSRKVEGNLDITTGRWKDGRIGLYRGVKEGDYKPLVTVWGERGEAATTEDFDYHGLVAVMAEFFQTGRAPIDPAETLEMVEFMAAAKLSLDRGGAEVKLAEVKP